MRASELIALFERMYDEHWAYEWGAAREGVVDCSGAFVYAFKKYGRSIAHGSNTIARELIRAGAMRPIGDARPGWALFRHAFDDGEPDKYKADGLGNYKHIALCSRDGSRALNAKGEQYGFCSDSLSGYAYAAPLPGVEYEEEKAMDALYQASVVTEKDPLRVRSQPGAGQIIGHIPKGAIADVLSEDGGENPWPLVRYGAVTGYASGAYLTRIGGNEPTGAEAGQAAQPSEEGVGTVGIPRGLAQQLYRALGEALSVD